ncbi:unnamed protein product [Fraxinus pennsylvanica]|uniref:Uncharacterized protein n=1 Tax=Fraxinus pennsylvanica TaxID=56036 RepID=A0AAD1YXM2_9LAMI|nr:unnamed protein product [Fraxinus pennsylvanica]
MTLKSDSKSRTDVAVRKSVGKVRKEGREMMGTMKEERNWIWNGFSIASSRLVRLEISIEGRRLGLRRMRNEMQGSWVVRRGLSLASLVFAVSVSEIEALYELFKKISSAVIDDRLINKGPSEVGIGNFENSLMEENMLSLLNYQH